MNTATTELSITELKAKRDAYLSENPKARARNVATDLGISEAQYVALDLGEGATRLGTTGLRCSTRSKLWEK